MACKVHCYTLDMSRQNTLATTGLLLVLASLVHLVRVLLEWEIVIDGGVLPLWASYVVIIVAGYLGFSALSWSRRGF